MLEEDMNSEKKDGEKEGNGKNMMVLDMRRRRGSVMV